MVRAQKTLRGITFPALILLALSGVSTARAADNFFFPGPPSNPGAGSYQVTNVKTFTINARTGGSLDNTFNNVVTVGLYNTVNPNPPTQLADPGVTIIGNLGTFQGTGPVSFVNGVATFTMTFETGSDSEQLYVQDSGGSPITNGDTYPGVFAGSIGGAAITVQGFPTDYYLGTVSGTSQPASYSAATTQYDFLTTDNTVIGNMGSTIGDVGVTINLAGGTTGVSGIDYSANAFAVTGISGGYAAGAASIINNLFLQRATALNSPVVQVQVIIDYNGTLTDFNNPSTSQDTVYSFTASTIALPPSFTTGSFVGGPVAGYLPFQQFMNNGQIIVRIWTTTPGNPVLMRWASSGGKNKLSYCRIPYSAGNIQPVRGTASPTLFGDNQPATLVYTINNQYNSPVTDVVIQVPPNSPVAGNPFNFTSVSGPAGSSPVITSNPTVAGAPGTITVNFSTPLAPNATAAITLIGTASDQTGSYPISMLSAVNANNGLPAPADPNAAVIQTLGFPNVPGSFTAAPVSFNSGGGAISLSWGQVSNENTQGYVITRNPGTDNFANPATLPNGTVINNAVTVMPNSITSYVDFPAPNLSGCTYTIQAFNGILVSSAASVGPVTAFANPGAPSPVTALTGGTAIQLSWAAPASVSGSYAVTGYQIWRDTQASMASAVPLTSTAASPYNDQPLSAGTTYYYAIASADSQYSGGAPGAAAHISPFSVTVSGNPPGNPPSIVGTPTLVNSSPATLQLNWNGPPDVLNTPLSGYEVSRAVTTGAFAPLTFLASAASPASIYDTAVTAGSYYVYEVQAVDSLGVTSNPSGAVTGRVGPPPPATPTAIPSGTGVTLVWPAVANGGGEIVVSYVVERSSSPIAAPVTTAAASMTYTDSGITAGTDYYYQVAAVDQNGVTGGFSGAVTSALLPPAPAALGVSLNLAAGNVAVTWATPAPAEPNLQQYSLTHAIGTATPTVIATPVAAAVSFSDAAVYPSNAGQTVTYNITAQNDLGGVGVSSSVSLIVPPNAPGGLAFSSSASAITLTWGAVAGQGVTGYTVYRTTLPAGTPTVIATPAGAAVTDNGPLVQGTNYAYYVTASNGGGAGLGSTPVTAALLLPAPAALGVSLNLATDNVAVTWATPSPAEPNLQQYSLTQAIGTATPTVIATPGAAAVSYFDASINPAYAGQTVTYTLSAQNSVGGTGAAASVNLVVPPNAPVGLGFTASSAAINLNWTAVAGQGVTGYTVYRTALPAGTPTAIATPSSAAYTDNSPSLTQGVSYVYDVTASNGGGAGLPSAGVTAGLAPPLPTGLNVSSIDVSNDIGVTWINVTGGSPNATAVSLLSNTVNNSGTATATNLAASAVTNNYAAQTPDTTYYYWLQTVNPFGTSALAGPVSQLTFPASVAIVSATLDADGTSRDLTWVPVGGADVTQYNIYRELYGGGSGFVSMGSASATGLTFPVKRTSPVLPGQVYIYKITAVNATGEGTSQNQVTIGIPPSSPVSVTAVSGVSLAAAVSLSWAEPNAVAQGVTAYSVYRSQVLAGPYGAPITSGLGPTNYLDASVTATGVYYYVIQADDNNNQSSPVTSTLAVAVTAYAQPNAPTGLGDTPGTGQISVTWSSAGVQTTYPIAGYNVYQSTAAGVTGVVVNATPVPGTSFTATGLTNGTAYYFSVQAVDNQGHASPVTGQINDTPVAPPGVPTGTAGSSGNNAVQVTWNPSTTGTLPVSFYQVEQIALSGPTTTYIQVPANQNGYVDNSASNGATYVFQVKAVDNTGVTTGVHASGFSAPPVTIVAGLITVNPPSQLTAKGGNNQVTLTWVDSSGGSPVTGYQIYRAETAPSPSAYTLLTSLATGTSPYTDGTAVNGTGYGYYFVAYSSGVASANSATIFATAAGPPAAPTALSTLDGGQEVISWTASPPQGVVTITQYYVVSSVNGGAAATIGSTSGATTYTDGTVSAGQVVVYEVGAVNSNGTTGVLSLPVTAYPYAPMTITSLTSTDSTSTVTLSWPGVGSPTWAPVQYNILRTTLTGSFPTTILNVTSPYVDSTGTLGQLYLYTVTAVDAKGHVSVAAGPVTDCPLNPPAAPATVIATAGNQQILIDWAPSAPVSDSLPVSEYILTGTNGLSVTLSADQTSYLDGYPNQVPLINGTTVTYSVQAVDSTGNFTGSHISSVVASPAATTSAALLNPPTGAAVTATNPTTNVLTWNRPNDEGYIVTGYNIYRFNSFTTVLNTPIATIPNPALNPVTVYNDTGLSASTTYFYVITANYQQGAVTVASPPSNHAWDKTPAPLAGVPPVTTGVMAFDANLLKPMTGQVLNIYYVAPDSGPVEIDVYNVSGNRIQTLNGVSTAGTKEVVTWDGKDRNGNTVASGIYLIEIKAPGLHQVKKVLVVK